MERITLISLFSMQYSAAKPLVLASMWIPLDMLEHLTLLWGGVLGLQHCLGLWYMPSGIYVNARSQGFPRRTLHHNKISDQLLPFPVGPFKCCGWLCTVIWRVTYRVFIPVAEILNLLHHCDYPPPRKLGTFIYAHRWKLTLICVFLANVMNL